MTIHVTRLSGAEKEDIQPLKQDKKEEKVSFKNKLDATVKKGFNAKTTLLKDEVALATGLGASIGGAALIAKSPKAETLLNKLKDSKLGELAKKAVDSSAGQKVQGYADKAINSSAAKKVKSSAENLMNKVLDSPLTQKAKNYASKGAAWVKALPKPAKAVLAAGTALTALVLNKTNTKGAYKAGQIDQEYQDKANVQNALE